MYADDLKFVKVISSANDVSNLQEDLYRLLNWCNRNKMYLNTNKCFHVKYHRKHNIITSSYFIDNEKIKELDSIRDLGILYDKKLTFVPHINNIIKKASNVLGFVIRKCKTFRNFKTKIIIYNTLVRSILEYGSVVWRPHYAVHALRIERIQKRFMWHLAFSTGMAKKVRSYNDRLKHFKLPSLDQRRYLSDAIFAFKIINNKVDCPRLLSSFNFRAPARIPRNSITPLYPPHRRTVLGASSPLARFCKVINGCSDVIDVHSDSLFRVKSQVSTCLSDGFLNIS